MNYSCLRALIPAKVELWRERIVLLLPSVCIESRSSFRGSSAAVDVVFSVAPGGGMSRSSGLCDGACEFDFL